MGTQAILSLGHSIVIVDGVLKTVGMFLRDTVGFRCPELSFACLHAWKKETCTLRGNYVRVICVVFDLYM